MSENSWRGGSVGIGVLALWVLGGPLFAAQPETPADLTQVVAGNNRFAWELYQQLRESPGDLFFSPSSISFALAMTANGARGQTATEMAQTLHLQPNDPQVAGALRTLIAQLVQPDKEQGYRLLLANRLWGQEGHPFKKPFLEAIRRDFGGDLSDVDFRQSEKARTTINDWVAEQTRDKIQNLIPAGALDARTRLVLTNAIYFKGDWRHTFAEDQTKTAPFQLASGGEVKTPLMYQKQRFRHADLGSLQMLELPYAGDRLAMLILLPKEADGLAAVEKQLSADQLEKWRAKLRTQEVQTYLPKFKVTAQFELNDVLSRLGMPTAFSDDADFSGISDDPLSISRVLHKAFVDVNEQGTEAAAATGVVVGVRSFQPSKPVVFRADHPFVFLIQDQTTGSLLFLGRLTDPSK